MTVDFPSTDESTAAGVPSPRRVLGAPGGAPAPGIAAAPNADIVGVATISLRLTACGQDLHLLLQPNEVLIPSSYYAERHHGGITRGFSRHRADGGASSVYSDFYQGKVSGDDNSTVAARFVRGKMKGLISFEAVQFAIEPLNAHGRMGLQTVHISSDCLIG